MYARGAMPLIRSPFASVSRPRRRCRRRASRGPNPPGRTGGSRTSTRRRRRERAGDDHLRRRERGLSLREARRHGVAGGVEERVPLVDPVVDDPDLDPRCRRWRGSAPGVSRADRSGPRRGRRARGTVASAKTCVTPGRRESRETPFRGSDDGEARSRRAGSASGRGAGERRVERGGEAALLRLDARAAAGPLARASGGEASSTTTSVEDRSRQRPCPRPRPPQRDCGGETAAGGARASPVIETPAGASRHTARAMRMRGLEPPRPYGHTDLNRARLPIPPHPRGTVSVAASSRSAGASFTPRRAPRAPGRHARPA